MAGFTLVINGVQINDITAAMETYPSPTGLYIARPPIADAPTETEMAYDDRRISFPGVMSIGTKRFGIQGRIITASIICLSTTDIGAAGLASSTMANFSSLNRYTISFNGLQRKGCKLALPMTSEHIGNFGGRAARLIRCTWQQLQEDGSY